MSDATIATVNPAALAPLSGSFLVGGKFDEGQARAVAAEMAENYAHCTAAMRRAFDIVGMATMKLHEGFARADNLNETYNRFGLRVEYGSNRGYALRPPGEMEGDGKDPYEGLFREMKVNAWQMLIEHTGVRSLMSLSKRKTFDEQVSKGDLPEITAENVLGVVLGLVADAGQMATEAAKEVFEYLRPPSYYGRQYVVNNHFRVGRRVVLSFIVRQGYKGCYEINYQREPHITALDSVFHVLDGRGPLKERWGPLANAIRLATASSNKGETDFFRFRCFKNGNLHLEFKRLDLVKQLNGLAAGEFVLGEDGEGSD